MKKKRLVCTQLRDCVSSNALIFSLFIVGSMLSCLVFIYFYGNTFSSKVGGHFAPEAYRGFEVWLDSAEYVDKNDLTLLDEFSIEEVEISTYIELDNIYKDLLPTQSAPQVYAYRYNGESVFEENILFSNQELIENSIYIPKELSKFEDDFFLDNVRFKVCGYTASPDTFVIPIDSYLNYFRIDKISFLCSQSLSQEQITQAETLLRSRYEGAEISTPSVAYKFDRQADRFAFMRVSMLYIIALFSFIFLFKYMIDSNSYENIVFLMVGAKVATVITMLMIEIIVLSALSFSMAVLIHVLLYKPLFNYINIKPDIFYSLQDYLFIAVSTIILSLFVSIPFIITCCRSSIIHMKRYFAR